MRKGIHLLIAVVGLAALLLVPNGSASAQAPSQSITVSPASTRLSVDPGATFSDTFEVINGGEDSYTVDLSAAPYHVSGEQYDPQFTQLPGTVNASEWVTLGTTQSELGGLKVLSVDYSVTVPANTAPGGYYAVIFAKTSRESTSGGIVPSNRVGNVLYITVNGDVKTSGNVTGSDIPGFTFSPATDFAMKVANDGGIHFETTATFKVTDITGKEVYNAKYERMILPSTVRNISTTWTSPLPFGIYTVSREATVGAETIKLDDQKIIVISPWFLITVFIFVAAIAAILFSRIRARRQSSKTRNPSKEK